MRSRFRAPIPPYFLLKGTPLKRVYTVYGLMRVGIGDTGVYRTTQFLMGQTSLKV